MVFTSLFIKAVVVVLLAPTYAMYVWNKNKYSKIPKNEKKIYQKVLKQYL